MPLATRSVRSRRLPTTTTSATTSAIRAHDSRVNIDCRGFSPSTAEEGTVDVHADLAITHSRSNYDAEVSWIITVDGDTIATGDSLVYEDRTRRLGRSGTIALSPGTHTVEAIVTDVDWDYQGSTSGGGSTDYSGGGTSSDTQPTSGVGDVEEDEPECVSDAQCAGNMVCQGGECVRFSGAPGGPMLTAISAPAARTLFRSLH